MFTAQEILVGNADYPTEKIAETSRQFRQLGLGYANLGALLMSQGLPYDSPSGRAWAASLTALMTGHAYATSARTAGRMGPFGGYADNDDAMLNVLRMHRAEAAKIDEELVPPELLSAAQRSWDDAVELGERYGVRNSQASVFAPTGTIGLMMDCDTTGIEPDLALTKAKKLVGGGTMLIVNQTIPRALRNLDYSDEQVEEIVSLHRRAQDRDRRAGLQPRAPPGVRLLDGRQHDPLHGSRHDDGCGAAVPLRAQSSKCIVGDSLVTTADGLVRIGSLHQGEAPDSFRDEVIEVASLGGTTKTDAFYYGGLRPIREVVLRSGHRVLGTPNHRLLVATDQGLAWRTTSELEPGDYVAVQYGEEMWAQLPVRFDDFRPSPPYGSQQTVRIPPEMTTELAFLLGAYASEGHTTRSNWTVTITNSVDEVLERVAAAWRSEFGIDARIERRADRARR